MAPERLPGGTSLRPATTLCRPIAGICDLQDTVPAPPATWLPSTSFVPPRPCGCLAQGPAMPKSFARDGSFARWPEASHRGLPRQRRSPRSAEYCSGTALTCPSDSLVPAGGLSNRRSAEMSGKQKSGRRHKGWWMARMETMTEGPCRGEGRLRRAGAMQRHRHQPPERHPTERRQRLRQAAVKRAAAAPRPTSR